MSKESELWEKIRVPLENQFMRLGDCHLEVTANRNVSDRMKRALKEDVLYMFKFLGPKGFFPDLMGFVEARYGNEIITVEVKREKISFRDIFQARAYSEFFNAKYGLLISPAPIPEVIRRFLIRNSQIYSYAVGYNKITICRFKEEDDSFECDRELYTPLPEPFRTNSEVVAYLFKEGDYEDKLEGSRVIVKNSKAYNMGDWLDELVKSRKVRAIKIPLKRPGDQFRQWLNKRGIEFIARRPNHEEIRLN